jgi:hypothetical protein
LLRVLLVDLGHKLACYRLSTPSFGFDASLNYLNFQPIWVSGSLPKLFDEIVIPQDFDLVPIVISHEGRIFIPVRFILLFPVFDDLRQLLPHRLKVAEVSLVVI